MIVFLFLLLGALRQAYLSLGVSSSTAMWLLFASLVGSYFNIPVANLPDERIMSNQVIDFFGMQYAVPLVSKWPGTVIAVNVGDARAAAVRDAEAARLAVSDFAVAPSALRC